MDKNMGGLLLNGVKLEGYKEELKQKINEIETEFWEEILTEKVKGRNKMKEFEKLTKMAQEMIEGAAKESGYSKFFCYEFLIRELGKDKNEWIEGTAAIAKYANVTPRAVFLWKSNESFFIDKMIVLPIQGGCDNPRYKRLSIRKGDLDEFLNYHRQRPGKGQRKGKYKGNARVK